MINFNSILINMKIYELYFPKDYNTHIYVIGF